MKWQASLSVVILIASQAAAQTARLGAPIAYQTAEPQSSTPPTKIVDFTENRPILYDTSAAPSNGMAGNRNFPNFIGFISNPVQNIDPRALTELWPMFGSSWVSAEPPLGAGNMQLYGAGLYLALNERLSIGVNQGGYAVGNFTPGRFAFADRDRRILIDRDRPDFRDGHREGWLNLGAFAQYTLIEDVPNQFLLSAGLRVEAPTGEADVFQGHGPAHLAPYITFGKEFGNIHVLGTVGYEFPTGSEKITSNTLYGNIHFDYQLGWLYPLVEFNWAQHTTNVDLDLDSRRGFFNFSNFESTGNIVTMAAGFNAVLIRDRLELGAVYTTPLATQRNFHFDGMLVKMVLRY